MKHTKTVNAPSNKWCEETYTSNINKNTNTKWNPKKLWMHLVANDAKRQILQIKIQIKEWNTKKLCLVANDVKRQILQIQIQIQNETQKKTLTAPGSKWCEETAKRSNEAAHDCCQPSGLAPCNHLDYHHDDVVTGNNDDDHMINFIIMCSKWTCAL